MSVAEEVDGEVIFTKYSDSSCTIRSLILAIIPATVLFALLPLTAPLGVHPYKASIFGNPVLFTHPLMYQFVEVRIYPLLALFFLGISFFVLLWRKERGFGQAKILFAMGMGPLAFSLLRFLLYWGFKETPHWANAWEEITEFLFIAIVFWICLRVWNESRTTVSASNGQYSVVKITEVS